MAVSHVAPDGLLTQLEPQGELLGIAGAGRNSIVGGRSRRGIMLTICVVPGHPCFGREPRVSERSMRSGGDTDDSAAVHERP